MIAEAFTETVRGQALIKAGVSSGHVAQVKHFVSPLQQLPVATPPDGVHAGVGAPIAA